MEASSRSNHPGPAEQRVTIGRSMVAYRVVGNGSPVVLVHGLAGSGRWWRHNIEPLAHHFRVFMVDLPGFGGNHGGAPVPLAAMPGLLAAWLDHLGLRRVALIGHSMGGRIVAELAADAPERVSRLILVDAAIFPAGPEWPRHARGLASALRYVSPTFLPVLATDAARAGPRNLLRASHALLTTGIDTKLPRITAPTLVVWGGRDTIVPRSLGEQVAALLPDARLVVVAGADHSPMWSRPAAFNAEVLAFLAEPDEAASAL